VKRLGLGLRLRLGFWITILVDRGRGKRQADGVTRKLHLQCPGAIHLVLGAVLALMGPRCYAQAPAVSNAPVTNGAAPIASVESDTPFASAILDHPGVKLPEQGPWTLSPDELLQMTLLISDLVEHRDQTISAHKDDPLFLFLWDLLSSETKSALEAERAKMVIRGVPHEPGPGQQYLVTNLNKLIQGKLIYDSNVFAPLKPFLSGDTVKLLNQPTGADLARLNRLLLEDAFPLDILRRPKILFDVASQNYIFVDFSKKAVSLYGQDGQKKWTADLGPSIAHESEAFPYFRSLGMPVSSRNVGLWDVSPRPGMLLVHILAAHSYSVNMSSGSVNRLPSL